VFSQNSSKKVRGSMWGGEMRKEGVNEKIPESTWTKISPNREKIPVLKERE